MVYVGNLVDGVLAAELTPTEPGSGWWIAARPYASARSSPPSGGARRRRPGGRHPPAAAARLASRVAETPTAAAGPLPLQPAAPRARQARPHDRLRHLEAAAANSATPTVDLAEGVRGIAWCAERHRLVPPTAPKCRAPIRGAGSRQTSITSADTSATARRAARLLLLVKGAWHRQCDGSRRRPGTVAAPAKCRSQANAGSHNRGLT